MMWPERNANEVTRVANEVTRVATKELTLKKSEAQELDLGHVYVKQKSAYQFQVVGERSDFLYAEFGGPMAEQEATLYADEEYNSYHDDGTKVN